VIAKISDPRVERVARLVYYVREFDDQLQAALQ
jgi:hypothetical protein